ncbi:MAG: hypothetical protein B7Z37_09860 [Verrucomicrobia bacterium 12-59-8]|nr:MAG: hypothetical protein B7Z37_09860 [Verrucomicrobia bacterium 12-59-8]
MTAVFIAGSITIKNLDQLVKERIDNIAASKFRILVGDASGVDTSIQQYLQQIGYRNAMVYCSGCNPRNNLGDWPVHPVSTNATEGTRDFFTAKDIEMAKAADFGLMIWDTKSTGTLTNVLEILARNKKSVVFINKAKSFKTIRTVTELDELIQCMSETAKMKAHQKMKLLDKIEVLRNGQRKLFE